MTRTSPARGAARARDAEEARWSARCACTTSGSIVVAGVAPRDRRQARARPRLRRRQAAQAPARRPPVQGDRGRGRRRPLAWDRPRAAQSRPPAAEAARAHPAPPWLARLPDRRLEGWDAAALVEVIEHLDPPRLAAFERVVFEFAQPGTVVITTPNREYNVRWPALPAGRSVTATTASSGRGDEAAGRLLLVRRGERDRRGLSELEDRPLEGGEAGGIEMLDDLHHGRGVEAREPAVAVERASRGGAGCARAARRQRSRSRRRGRNPASGSRRPSPRSPRTAVGEQALEQLAVAAAEVEHPLGAGLVETAAATVEPPVVEAERDAPGRPPRRRGPGASLRAAASSSSRSGRGPRAPAPLVPEIAPRDQLPLRVRGEPALAVAQQLLDLRSPTQ